MNFSQRLESLRLEKGYTQEELAKFVNISQPAYCAYERGINLPHKNTQIQLAKVLGITVEELMKDDSMEVHYENSREATRSPKAAE